MDGKPIGDACMQTLTTPDTYLFNDIQKSVVTMLLLTVAVIGLSTAPARGSDDPLLPEISVTNETAIVYESAEEAVFFLESDLQPTTDIEVKINVTETHDFIGKFLNQIDTARNSYKDNRTVPDRIYSTGEHTVVLSSGATRRKVAVNLVDDKHKDPTGTITVEVLEGVGYSVTDSDNSTSEITILDWDQGVVVNRWIQSASKVVDEGDTAYFTVFVDYSDNRDRTYDVRVSDGGSDFLAANPPTSVLIKAGAISGVIAVDTVNDNVEEKDGRITVDLIGKSDRAFTVVRDLGGSQIPTISIEKSSATITEGGTANFTFSADPIAPESDLDVNIGVHQLGDFLSSSPSSTFSFNGGQRTGTLDLTTDDDRVKEDSGSVTVRILPGKGYQVRDSSSTAQIEISDNETEIVPLISVYAEPQVVEEGNPVRFEFHSGNMKPTANLAIKLRITEVGSFLAATPPNEATLSMGQYFDAIEMATLDDGNAEANGLVTLEVLPNGANYHIKSGKSTAMTEIADNDGFPYIEIGATDLSTPESGSARFVISATNPAPSGGLAIKLSVEQDGEFLVKPPRNSFNLAASKSYEYFNIPLVDDTAYEEDGSVSVTILPGNGYGILVGGATATMTVTDNDPTPHFVEVGSTKSSVTEKEYARFVIASDKPAPSGGLLIGLKVEELGTFLGTPHRTSFRLDAGKYIDYFNLPLVDDAVHEDDGLVTVRIKSGSGYRTDIESRVATMKILDDDPPLPKISVHAAHSAVDEGEPAIFNIVSETRVPVGGIQVNFTVTQVGNFVSTVPASPFSFDAGKAIDQLSLPTADNNILGPDGEVTLTVQSGTGYEVNTAESSDDVVILDDDTVAISISVEDRHSPEVTFTADPAPQKDLEIHYITYNYSDRIRNRIPFVYGYIAHDNYVVLEAGQQQVKSRGFFSNRTGLDNFHGSHTSWVYEIVKERGYTIQEFPNNSVATGTLKTSSADIDMELRWFRGEETDYQYPHYEGNKFGFELVAGDYGQSWDEEVVVNLSYSDGGLGLLPDDLPDTVTIPAGSGYVFKKIVNTLKDDNVEGDSGQISVKLLPGPGYILTVDSQISWPVSDNDGRIVQFNLFNQPAAALEGDDIEFEVVTNTIVGGSEPDQFNLSVPIVFDDGSGDFINTTSLTVELEGTRFARKKFKVGTIDDSIDEADGTVSATIQSGTGYRLGAVTTVSASVIDNDEGPHVSIQSLTESIVEGETAHFLITTEFPTDDDLEIGISNFSAYIGLRRGWAHFITSVPDTVTLDAGETRTFLALKTDDDEVDEPAGTLSISLEPGEGYFVHWRGNVATVEVEDNDGTEISIEAVEESISEGYTLRFLLSADNEIREYDLPVPIQLDDGNGNLLERVSKSPIAETKWGVVLGSRQREVEFHVELYGNNVDDPDSEVVARILDAPLYGTEDDPRSYGYTISETKSEAVVTVLDRNDPYISMQRRGSDTLVEGSDMVINLRLQHVAWQDLEVDVEISDGGTDVLQNPPTKFLIEKGKTSAEFRIPTHDDDVDEGRGYVTVKLVDGDGYRLEPTARTSAEFIVKDNDTTTSGHPIRCARLTSSVTEGGSVRFRIFSNAAFPTEGITLNYVTIDTGAGFKRSGPMTVELAGGTTVTERYFEVATEDDQVSGDGGQFIVKVQPGDDYSLLNTCARVTLVDNDTDLKVSVNAVKTTPLTEGEPALFEFSTNYSRAKEMIVGLTVTDGDGNPSTFTNGNTSHLFRLPAGNSNFEYAVKTIDDAEDDLDGEIHVEIKDLDHYSVSDTHGTDKVEVKDNDIPEISLFHNILCCSSTGVPVLGNLWKVADFKIIADIAPSSDLEVAIHATDWDNGYIESAPSSVLLKAGEKKAEFEIQVDENVYDQSASDLWVFLLKGEGYTVSESHGSDFINVSRGNVLKKEYFSVVAHTYDLDAEYEDEFNTPSLFGAAFGAIHRPQLQGTVMEGDDIRFQILSSRRRQDVTVDLKVTDGGTGYLLSAPESVTFYAGGAKREIVVRTRDNDIREEDGYITVSIIGGEGYIGGNNAATVLVMDNDGPEVSVEAVSRSITEGSDAQFRIRSDSRMVEDITIGITVDDHSRDFISSPPDSVDLDIGGQEKIVSVPTIGDQVDEASGTVTLTIEPGIGYTLPDVGRSASVTVLDDDSASGVPSISIEAVSTSVVEGGSATFKLRTNTSISGNINIGVLAEDGAGDFIIDQPAPIPMSGAGPKNFDVTTRDNRIDEHGGTLTVHVTGGAGYSVSSSQGSASVMVTDNDVPEVSIFPVRSFVWEGQRAAFMLTADIVPVDDLSITVTMSNGDGNSLPIDQRQMTINLGAGYVKTYGILIADSRHTEFEVRTARDQIDEAMERVTATIQSGTGYSLSSSNSSATVEVWDNPVVSSIGTGISIHALESTVEEGGLARFKLTKNKMTSESISVNISADDGDDNFVDPSPAPIEMANDINEKIFTMPIMQYAVDEDGGNLKVKILAGTGYYITILNSFATVAVTDSGLEKSSITLTTLATGVTEGATFDVTLRATPEPTGSATISIDSLSIGLGFAGLLSAGTSGSALTIDSSGTATVTVRAVNDDVYSNGGTLVVNLSDGTGYTADTTNRSVSVPVTDNESKPVVSLSVSPGTVAEGGTATVTLTALPKPGGSVSLSIENLAVVGTGFSGTLDTGSTATPIAIGASGQGTAMVTVADDSLYTNGGILQVMVGDGANYTASGTNGTVDLTVTENEPEPVIELTTMATTVAEGGTFSVTLTPTPMLGGSYTLPVTTISLDSTGFSGLISAGTGLGTALTLTSSGPATATVTASDDDVYSNGGTIKVRLADGTGYAASTSANSIDLPVTENEGIPVVSLSRTGGNVVEGVAFSVTLRANPRPGGGHVLSVTTLTVATGFSAILSGGTSATPAVIGASGETIVSVTPADDDVDTDGGTLTISLTDGIGYTAKSDERQVVVTVTDNEGIRTISLIESTTTVGEGGTFTITLSADVAPTLGKEIDISTLLIDSTGFAGTISSGTSTSSIARIGTGNSVTVLVAVSDDSVYSNGGMLTVRLSGTATYAPHATEGLVTVTVTENEPTPVVSLMSETTAVAEGETFTVTLTATPRPGGSVVLSITTLSINSTNVVATLSSGTNSQPLEIDGSGTETVNVSVEEDSELSDDRELQVHLTSGTGYNVESPAIVIVTVTDNDTPVVRIHNPAFPFIEGETVIFPVSAQPAPQRNTTVHVNVEDGQANNLEGATSLTLVLTIEKGQSNTELRVPTIVDDSSDDNGVLTATLLGGSGYNLSLSETEQIATATILNLFTPRITITTDSNSIMEGDTANFVVTAKPLPQENIVVNIEFRQIGSFIKNHSNVRTTEFDKEQETSSLVVESVDDNVDEDDGWILARVVERNGVRYEVGSVNPILVVVQDNDAEPEIMLEADSQSPLMEGQSARFTLTAVGTTSSRDLRIFVNVTQMGDLIPWRSPESIVLKSGQTSTYLVIQTVDDNLHEENGEIIATVLEGGYYSVHESHSDRVKFIDNDEPGAPDATMISVASVGIRAILSNGGDVGDLNSGGGEFTVSVLPVTGSVVEGSPVRFRINSTLASDSGMEINVRITTTPGALGSVLPNVASIPAGQKTTLVDLPTLDDNIAEPDSIVSLELEAGLGYEVDSANNVALVVVSDELDRQRHENTINASRTVLPDLLNAMASMPVAATVARMDNAFDGVNRPPVTIGGVTGVKSIVLHSGQLVNGDMEIDQALLEDIAVEFDVNPESGTIGRVKLWGHRNRDSLTGGSELPNWDGNVLTGQVGMDHRFDRSVLTGLSVYSSEALANIENSERGDDLLYQVRTSGIQPYFGWRSEDRDTRLLVNAGYGTGAVRIENSKQAVAVSANRQFLIDIGIEHRILAHGDQESGNNFDVFVRGNVNRAEMFVDDRSGLLGGSKYEEGGLGVAIEADHSWRFADGVSISPSLMVGVAGKIGHGFGAEFGSGIEFAEANTLTFDGSGRAVVMPGLNHKVLSFEASFNYDRNSDELGLTMEVEPSWQVGSFSGVDTIRDWDVVGNIDSPWLNRDGAKFESVMGYGFSLWNGSGVLKPFGGLDAQKGREFGHRLGGQIAFERDSKFKLEFQNMPSTGNTRHQKLMLGGTMKW